MTAKAGEAGAAGAAAGSAGAGDGKAGEGAAAAGAAAGAAGGTGDGKAGGDGKAAGEGAGAGDGKAAGEGGTAGAQQQQGAQGAAGDGKGGKADEGAPQSKAPDKYALTVPDGGYLDTDDLKQIEAIAREAGWSNEDAQAAVEEHAAALRQQSERWMEATKADKDYGGEKLAETQKLANAVIARLRPEGHPRREAFMKFIHRGGAFNHVEVVSFLADLGKLMGEDGATAFAGDRGGSKKDTASKFYDHPTSQVKA